MLALLQPKGTQMLTRFRSALSLLSKPLALLSVISIVGCSNQWHNGQALMISTQPADQTIVARHSAAFSVTAAGIGPLTYEWFENGEVLPGATSPTFASGREPLSMPGSKFRVRVTDAARNVVESETALLLVTPITPDLTIAPIPTHAVGDPAFQVTAASTSPGAISYSVLSGSASLRSSWVDLAAAGPVVL
jgi:hypothetical protein